MRRDRMDRRLRLLTITFLPLLGLALLMAIMAHQPQLVRAGAANVWWVDGADGDNGYSCLAPDAPCETISGAISKAAGGDLIHVAAGVYSENVTIDKNLTLVGGFDANWLREPGERATIHPLAGGRVVQVSQNVTTTLVGFSLTGGRTTLGSGAGLYASDAHVTMEDCAVVDNHNQGIRWGGGIYFQNVKASLTQVDLSDNTISGTAGLALGGGIAIRAGSEVVIADSRVISNSAGGGGVGSMSATILAAVPR